MSPASGDNLESNYGGEEIHIGFHSINVPSEWGRFTTPAPQNKTPKVSIQLMSPASGDVIASPNIKANMTAVSIQLMSPASGDHRRARPRRFGRCAFPFN